MPGVVAAHREKGTVLSTELDEFALQTDIDVGKVLSMEHQLKPNDDGIQHTVLGFPHMIMSLAVGHVISGGGFSWGHFREGCMKLRMEVCFRLRRSWVPVIQD
jgi:hypothetical protein